MSDPEVNTVSLLQHLDSPQITCLNESEEHTLKSIVADRTKNIGDAYLLSETDEQLLLNIAFNTAVKIKSIALQTANVAQGPRTIRLVINRQAVGFEDMEDAKAALQEIELTEEQVREGLRVPLRYVKFQNVTSLHLFVMSNQGGEDETRIDSIDVFGSPLLGTRDVSGLKKVGQDE